MNAVIEVPALLCRPNLVPTWDLRRAALVTVAIWPEPLNAERVSELLADRFGRANEDDYFATRAALSWMSTKKLVSAVRYSKRQQHPTYVITERGLAALDGPTTVFL